MSRTVTVCVPFSARSRRPPSTATAHRSPPSAAPCPGQLRAEFHLELLQPEPHPAVPFRLGDPGPSLHDLLRNSAITSARSRPPGRSRQLYGLEETGGVDDKDWTAAATAGSFGLDDAQRKADQW
ncbi:hypothetical protein AMK31_37610 [Streptomyces sp. TSRI0107]|nr:hypothetical protein AMK31_37610 [Streptomyces sp. TSRI0107]